MPVGQKILPRPPPSAWCFGVGIRPLDCQHIHCCQRREPARGKSRPEPRCHAVAAAADGIRRAGTCGCDCMTKVLVIDDEAQIRRFLRAGFELHGFSVIEAENATAGLRAATMSALDLIILDLNLLDLEGSDVLERVRSWSNIPII